MHSDVYHCDKCGELMPKDYEPRDQQLTLVVREDEQFHGPPKCTYENKDICLTCLVKAMREWFYKKAQKGFEKPDDYDFSLTMNFCETLKKGEEKNDV